MLSAALYKQSNGNLKVLDGTCDYGIRLLRYLMEAKADFVLANYENDSYGSIIVDNLSQVSNVSDEEKRWTMMHSEIDIVMMNCYYQDDIFDLIDLPFGRDSNFIGDALYALKLGGLLYLTSTDGSLAKHAAYVRPMPYSNEIGLRMLIGCAVWEALEIGYHVKPLFSYYSNHGGCVFRAMLQIKGGECLSNISNFNYVSYCKKCGDSQTFSWDGHREIGCTCDSDVGNKVVVSGPLWTGPLHDASHLVDILNLADQWGWTSNGTGKSLEKLIKQMIDESDPRLPSGYIKLNDIARRAKLNSPSFAIMMNALQKEGYVAIESHIASKAIKTNCPMIDRVCKDC